MIDDIRRLRQNVPFVPFRVHRADGRKFPVPTIDHFLIVGRRAIILLGDDELVEILPAYLISGLTTDQSALPVEPVQE